MVQDRTRKQHLRLSNCSRSPLSYAALPKSTTIWQLVLLFNCALNYSEWNEQSERVVLFHSVTATSTVYHFRPHFSKSSWTLAHQSTRLWVRVQQAELNFLLSFLFPCHFPSTFFCVLIFIPLCLALIRDQNAL